MKSGVLDRWLEMAVDDEIEVDPTDINHEGRTNM